MRTRRLRKLPESGDGPGVLALALLALLALVARRRVVGSRWGLEHRRLAAGTAVGAVAVALTLAAPHLVHHALDADQGASCAVLRIAGNADATPAATPSPVVSSAAIVAELSVDIVPAPVPLATARGRAPPI